MPFDAGPACPAGIVRATAIGARTPSLHRRPGGRHAPVDGRRSTPDLRADRAGPIPGAFLPTPEASRLDECNQVNQGDDDWRKPAN
ncbi:hypothetical protein UK82_03155 [Frankia sp. ACN1ag]|nr:hypothetical protein UK82_03155 [Frankia sp. ACN1ag]